jgi:D-3-phosphoglycerate dehydrogenase
VIATPHLGASTEEAQHGVAADVAEQIAAVLGGGVARWVVNAPSVLPEEMQAVRPFLPLAEKLGSLYAQLGGGGVERLEIDYTGELARHHVAYLTAAVIKGMLASFTEDRVNVVNARVVAQARGIEVVELRSSARDEYADLITLKVAGRGPEFVAAATVLPQGGRIVRLDSFRIDMIPEGRFLVTYHDDRPGMIGKIGTALGEANINIAALQLGRDAPRGHAVMIIAIDDEVPDATREKLRAIEGMTDLKYVRL